MYSHCNSEKNKDGKIKKKWKVYRLDGEDKFNIMSVTGKCLTRVPYENKKPEDLQEGLYEKDDILGSSFASTKLMDCSKENENNQKFDIKYMGDTQNCKVANDIPEVQRIDIEEKKKQAYSVQTDIHGQEGNFIMRD